MDKRGKDRFSDWHVQVLFRNGSVSGTVFGMPERDGNGFNSGNGFNRVSAHITFLNPSSAVAEINAMAATFAEVEGFDAADVSGVYHAYTPSGGLGTVHLRVEDVNLASALPERIARALQAFSAPAGASLDGGELAEAWLREATADVPADIAA